MTKPEISLALPCYNESEGIADVLRRSVAALERLGRPWEIVVIDNASGDGTADVVREFFAGEPRGRVVVHETNRFYSGSCKTALAECRGRYVAIMDSDGQFTADDLPRFLRALECGANLVFGVRRVRHDPVSRKAMSRVFNGLARFYLGCPLRDLNVGLRMFDRTFVGVADIRHRLNVANPELYVSAKRAGLKIAEVTVTHAKRETGRSCHDPKKLWNLFRDLLAYFDDLRGRLKQPAAPSKGRVAA
jgi:undecaprenyl-phosphate 4-deoxy-4-formamido-L-arabinose transferase